MWDYILVVSKIMQVKVDVQEANPSIYPSIYLDYLSIYLINRI